MVFDYFYKERSESYTFYRIPKVLFTEESFQKLSTDAKVLYGLLLERTSLSRENGWFDENGRVYVYFTIKAVKASMNCANDKACGLLKELERIGLIEKRKQGLCKPTIIYVKDFMGFRKAEHRDSDNQNFGIPKIRILDDRKSESNNTEKNNTELNNTNLILSGSDVDKDERSVYHDILMEQLSMEILYERYPIERETLDAILDMMLDIICSKKEYILIAGDNELYPLSRTQEILVAPFFRQL